MLYQLQVDICDKELNVCRGADDPLTHHMNCSADSPCDVDGAACQHPGINDEFALCQSQSLDPVWTFQVPAPHHMTLRSHHLETTTTSSPGPLNITITVAPVTPTQDTVTVYKLTTTSSTRRHRHWKPRTKKATHAPPGSDTVAVKTAQSSSPMDPKSTGHSSLGNSSVSSVATSTTHTKHHRWFLHTPYGPAVPNVVWSMTVPEWVSHNPWGLAKRTNEIVISETLTVTPVTPRKMPDVTVTVVPGYPSNPKSLKPKYFREDQMHCRTRRWTTHCDADSFPPPRTTWPMTTFTTWEMVTPAVTSTSVA